MPKSSKNIFRFILPFLAIYAIIMLRWGYEYGRNDQMQTLGYAKAIANPDLYLNDNYVQGMLEKVPNERFLFSYIMSWADGYYEPISFLLHIGFSLALFILLFQLARQFIQKDWLIWLYLLVLFIPFYNLNLGGNELWYNTFFVSNPIKVIGLAAILLFLKNKYISSFLLLGFSTMLQPVVGFQLFVTLSAILILGKWIAWISIEYKAIAKAMGCFLLTGGIWIVFLKLFFDEASLISNETFFDILFEFRAPHHYLPFAYSKKAYLILLPLFIFSFNFYRKKDQKLALFFLVSFIGMLIYVLLVEMFHEVNVAALQWFKVSIWMKAFGLIALFAWIESQFKFLDRPVLTKLAFPSLMLTGLLAVAILLFGRAYLPFQVPFDWQTLTQRGDAVDIALKAKSNSPKDALFLHPIGFTELKVYGERSSFVEFKILVHRKNAMKKWYDRLQIAYGPGMDIENKGFKAYEVAERNMKERTASFYSNLKKTNGIDYLITYADHQLDFTILAENKTYRLYKLE